MSDQKASIQARQVGPVNRNPALLTGAWHGWLCNPIDDEADSGDRRNNRDPEYQSEIVVAYRHEQNYQHRSDESADCIHSLTKAKCSTALLNGGYIGNQGVARRAANTLPDAVDEACDQHQTRTARKGKERFGQRRETVSEQDKRLSPAHPVTDRAREHFRDRGRCFGDPFDNANRKSAHAKHRHQE
jgi:hypothetical protein